MHAQISINPNSEQPEIMVYYGNNFAAVLFFHQLLHGRIKVKGIMNSAIPAIVISIPRKKVNNQLQVFL